DAGERAFGFRLDRARSSSIHVQDVVREAEAGLHRKLADGDASSGSQVEFIAALNEPACRDEFGIYLASGPGLWCFGHWLARPQGQRLDSTGNPDDTGFWSTACGSSSATVTRDPKGAARLCPEHGGRRASLEGLAVTHRRPYSASLGGAATSTTRAYRGH